jgi:hypothetical protein
MGVVDNNLRLNQMKRKKKVIKLERFNTNSKIIAN